MALATLPNGAGHGTLSASLRDTSGAASRGQSGPKIHPPENSVDRPTHPPKD